MLVSSELGIRAMFTEKQTWQQPLGSAQPSKTCRGRLHGAALRLMPQQWGLSPASVACVLPFISGTFICLTQLFLTHLCLMYLV